MKTEIIKKKIPIQWSYYEAVRIKGRMMHDVARDECSPLSLVEKMVNQVEQLLQQRNNWFDCLSTRTANAIFNAGFATKKQVKTAILANRLNPGTTRNYGTESHYELCRFLGIIPPDPVKQKAPTKIWQCPHCRMFIDNEEREKAMWVE